MLEVSNIDVFYGDAQAIWNATFSVHAGEIVSFVGSNGAGKTTLLKTISGLLAPKRGTIRFNGTELIGLPPHKIVELGLSHIPEGKQLFPDMTVWENLDIGAYTRRAKEVKDKTSQLVYDLFPVLKERRNQYASTLSGGEQQMLSIGRGMMSMPNLLLIDEPSSGLAPNLVQRVFDVINQIHSKGVTIMLVEQNVKRSLEIADRGYVLETGRIKLEGKGSDLVHDDYVSKSYLGM